MFLSIASRDVSVLSNYPREKHFDSQGGEMEFYNERMPAKYGVGNARESLTTEMFTFQIENQVFQSILFFRNAKRAL